MSSRQHYHEQLWRCFEAQTWPDKELIVVETFEEAPSEFLQEKAKADSCLVHICFQVEADEDFTVGLKRDMTLHLASGEFVANFDDDDFYAASYLSKMVGELQARGLVALTLSSWFNYFETSRACGYSDPSSWTTVDAEEIEDNLYGYGFSYVHRRHMALALPYPNVEFAEDAPFMYKLRDTLGDGMVGLRRDTEGICMHLVHTSNSTQDPELWREVPQPELERLEVWSLPIFREYLDVQSRSWWPSWLHVPPSIRTWASAPLAMRNLKVPCA